MSHKKSPKELAKVLAYILGRRPDEFGLLPDSSGYVKIKELLKALSEEEGWRYVRRSHLDEVQLTQTNPPIEISENLIRARDRERLPPLEAATDLPKLLYTCIRRKAYPFVAAKGLMKSDGDVVLCTERETAERIGKRIDRSPVTLTVQVQKSLKQRVRFFNSGETLYTAAAIPANCFTGPPLPKERPDLTPPADMVPAKPKKPGSFTIDILSDGTVDASSGDSRNKKEPPWKKKRKKGKGARHEKPPWRR
jgi:putative RNA 2'-phosphotransferase